jgi:hypothetical protein
MSQLDQSHHQCLDDLNFSGDKEVVAWPTKRPTTTTWPGKRSPERVVVVVAEVLFKVAEMVEEVAEMVKTHFGANLIDLTYFGLYLCMFVLCIDICHVVWRFENDDEKFLVL